MPVSVLLACLIIVGAIGVVSTGGLIFLVAVGADIAKIAIITPLASSALAGVLGFMTGRSTAQIEI